MCCCIGAVLYLQPKACIAMVPFREVEAGIQNASMLRRRDIVSGVFVLGMLTANIDD